MPAIARLNPKLSHSSVGRFRRVTGIFISSILMFVLANLALGNIQAFKIVSRSMAPTLKVGDQVLAVPTSWCGGAIRNRVIAFMADDGGSPLTKRVLGMEGDQVTLQRGLVAVNGQADNHSSEKIRREWRNRNWSVPEGHLFVVGDNRNKSEDSIDHGPVSESAMLGVIGLCYWPPSRVGLVR